MSHRDWNPRAFFRALTPDVARALAAHLDITLTLPRGTTSNQRLYVEWKALDEARQQLVEAELRPVNDMCSSHARHYLVELARKRWASTRPDWVPFIIAWSTHDLAVRLHLEDPRAFTDAHRNYGVDMLDNLKEYRGKYVADVVPSVDRKERMKAAMRDHLREEARSEHCLIEDFVNDEKLALFVYAEDELTAVERFNPQGQLEPDWQRPVFRIAAVFHFDTCTLLVKAPRRSEREKLRQLFAEIFVGDRDYFEDPSELPRYDFCVLRDRDFDFRTYGSDHIDRVNVQRVTVRPAHRDVVRMTLEFRPGLPLERVQAALQSHGVRVPADNIEGAGLVFHFEGSGRARQRTVNLDNPNTSNLRDTERDRVIRRYLREWNIDADRRNPVVAAAFQGAAE